MMTFAAQTYHHPPYTEDELTPPTMECIIRAWLTAAEPFLLLHVQCLNSLLNILVNKLNCFVDNPPLLTFESGVC